MSKKEVCPWCDTEIVWDDELGREETCPHCYNELEEYRSVQIAADDSEPEHKELELNLDFSNVNEETLNIDELNMDEHGTQDFFQYEQAVDQLREQTDKEALECAQCQEMMVYVGHQMKNEFQSIELTGLFKGLLNNPYSVDVHVCPNCFEVRYVLSDEDRIEFMSTMKRFGEAK